MVLKNLKTQDPQIAKWIKQELKRQQDVIELIPSENYVSPAVLEALGSVLTNKYAEGYPGRRYYGGCENVDEIETLAIDRAKKLFQAQHVNVQPLSGAPANIAVYSALLSPGDTILGMDLGHGGHLTHGHPVTFMAKIYNFVRYKTDPATGLIDYHNLRQLARAHKPKMILAGYSAYSRDIDYQKIKEIASEVGALTMADISHIAGLIASGLMNNPVPLFDVTTTTTHKTLRGPRGGLIMCQTEHAAKIDKAVFPGLQGGPHQNNIAGIAVALGEALGPDYKSYCKQIIKNAKALEKSFTANGIELCFRGTENHLLLLDVWSQFKVSGHEAQVALDAANITLNKNMIPDDPRKPLDPSGIRFGTPAATTRGMKEPEMKQIAEMIVKILRNFDNKKIITRIKHESLKITKRFPLYK